MTPADCTASFRSQVVSFMPKLRGYARLLTRRADAADDLLQDTVMRALGAEAKFIAGTNIRAWLFTIMRNQHITTLRSHRNVYTPIDDVPERSFGTPGDQLISVEFGELRRALMQLSPAHREVLLLVAAVGCTYEEAAEICGCAVGTIKSRLNRAKLEIAACLNGVSEADAAAPVPAEAGLSTARSASATSSSRPLAAPW
jgi:RNA polymerase sigma-70 factor (ECF subfamily)